MAKGHQNITQGLVLGLVILLSACNAPKATPCPTAEPQSCPTTSAAILPPEMNSWRQSLSGAADIRFKFEPGDKCTMIGPHQFYSPDWAYEIVVNDQAHLNYAVAGLTLNPGENMADVEKWMQDHPNSEEPAPQMTIRFYDVVGPMSRTFHGITYTGEPIYFFCITQGPDAHNVIASFDPVVVPKE